MTGDARPIPFSVWRKIAMASWRPRKDSAILATIDVDAGALLGYIDDVRAATGAHVTPVHLVGRATAKVFEALPGLNGRVVFGQFLRSPTIDCFFVVSLRTDPTGGTEAAATDLSGSVVRNVDQKPPWAIARELADRAALIRADRDPQFKQTKQMVKLLPPLALRAVTDTIGFITEGLQLPMHFIGLDARPYGSFLVSNVGTYGLDTAFAPVPPFCHVPAGILVGAVTDKVVARRRPTGRVPDPPARDRPRPPVRRRVPGGDDGEDLSRVPGRSRPVRPRPCSPPTASAKRERRRRPGATFTTGEAARSRRRRGPEPPPNGIDTLATRFTTRSARRSPDSRARPVISVQ